MWYIAASLRLQDSRAASGRPAVLPRPVIEDERPAPVGDEAGEWITVRVGTGRARVRGAHPLAALLIGRSHLHRPLRLAGRLGALIGHSRLDVRTRAVLIRSAETS